MENLYKFECRTAKDVLDLFHYGLQNRAVASHKLNHASSRSHSILVVTVDSVDASNTVRGKAIGVGGSCGEQAAIGGSGGFRAGGNIE